MAKLEGEALAKARARMAHARANRKPKPEVATENLGGRGIKGVGGEERTEALATPDPATGKDAGFYAVLESVIRGSTVAEACRECGVSVSAIYKWKSGSTEAGAAFAHARQVNASLLAGEAIAAARRLMSEAVDQASVNGVKAGLDAILKILSRLDPANWGEAPAASVTVNLGSLHLAAVREAVPIPGRVTVQIPAVVAEIGADETGAVAAVETSNTQGE